MFSPATRSASTVLAVRKMIGSANRNAAAHGILRTRPFRAASRPEESDRTIVPAPTGWPSHTARHNFYFVPFEAERVLQAERNTRFVFSNQDSWYARSRQRDRALHGLQFLALRVRRSSASCQYSVIADERFGTSSRRLSHSRRNRSWRAARSVDASRAGKMSHAGLSLRATRDVFIRFTGALHRKNATCGDSDTVRVTWPLGRRWPILPVGQ